MMSDEERAEAAKQWDTRTPFERFESLSRDEKTAFLALFAGVRSRLQGRWSPSRGTSQPSFGKAECEWANFDLWRFKLPGLRLTTYEEGPRKVALGMEPGSVCWDIHISVTEDGWEARETYWANLRSKREEV